MRAPASGPFSSTSQPLLVAVATVLAIGPATGHPDVTQILAGARAVLGDVTRVRTFTATGHTRQRRGGRSPVAFEIAAQLLDRYVRVDAAPVQGGAQTRSGFNGDDLIQRPAPVPPQTPASKPGAAPFTQMDAMRRARITAIKQDFARLLLGMFGSSMGAYPLTFSHGGSGDAPQGRADIVEARGAGNLALRIFIYQDTHLPAMITWPVPEVGRAVENRLIFSDYRDVEGLRLPFHYERAVGPEVVEETIVERYRINVRIDARTFDVPK